MISQIEDCLATRNPCAPQDDDIDHYNGSRGIECESGEGRGVIAQILSGDQEVAAQDVYSIQLSVEPRLQSDVANNIFFRPY